MAVDMSSPMTSGVTAGSDRNGATPSPAVDGLEVVTDFGASMLRAGHTACQLSHAVEVVE